MSGNRRAGRSHPTWLNSTIRLVRMLVEAVKAIRGRMKKDMAHLRVDANDLRPKFEESMCGRAHLPRLPGFSLTVRPAASQRRPPLLWAGRRTRRGPRLSM